MFEVKAIWGAYEGYARNCVYSCVCIIFARTTLAVVAIAVLRDCNDKQKHCRPPNCIGSCGQASWLWPCTVTTVSLASMTNED